MKLFSHRGTPWQKLSLPKIFTFFSESVYRFCIAAFGAFLDCWKGRLRPAAVHITGIAMTRHTLRYTPVPSLANKIYCSFVLTSATLKLAPSATWQYTTVTSLDVNVLRVNNKLVGHPSLYATLKAVGKDRFPGQKRRRFTLTEKLNFIANGHRGLRIPIFLRDFGLPPRRIRTGSSGILRSEK
jgi:hypothetical protein